MPTESDLLAGWGAVAAVAALAFAVNLPFGWWRAGVEKFSWRWFVAVHAAVPVVVGARFLLGVPFRWSTLPLFVLGYFAGQAVGARLRARGELRGGRLSES